MRTSFGWVRPAFPALVAALFFGAAPAAYGQLQMVASGPGGSVRLLNSDEVILEIQEARSDLPCSVEPIKPLLGFDLRFHSGYQVKFPLRELAGQENLLTVIFRVTPDGRPDDPTYFFQRIRVPSIEEDAKGDAYLEGAFDVGEGRYKVDWLMRDRAERVCSSYWDVEAALPAKDRELSIDMEPGSVTAPEREFFREEPPVKRIQDDQPLNVKVLVNFAPQRSYSAAMQPRDMNALVSILRSISRQPEIGRFSLVAFNLEQQQVLYKQSNSERIDFPALGEALEGLTLGTVDFKNLAQKNSRSDFLSSMIREELNEEERPDAVIFAGPKALLDEKIPEDALREIGSLDYPVFYMNYNLYPHVTPWRDAIGNAVRFLRGAEYTISRPRDLWFAVTDIVSQMVKSKELRRGMTASKQ